MYFDVKEIFGKAFVLCLAFAYGVFSMHVSLTNFTSIGWFILAVHGICALMVSIDLMNDAYRCENAKVKLSKNSRNVSTAKSRLDFFEFKYMLCFPVAPIVVAIFYITDRCQEKAFDNKFNCPPRSIPVR